MEWKETIRQHFATNRLYRQTAFLEHFADETAEKELRRWYAANKHKPMTTFSGVSNEWQAFVAPTLQMEAIQYGLVDDLPSNLITTVGADSDAARMAWVWKSEGIEDYVEGEEFRETYIEGATSIERWRKPAAKIVNTYEAIKDLPLSLITMNVGLTLNEFKAREWKHFTHELHRGTSNKFPPKATDKHGNPLEIDGWRDLHENAYTPETPDAKRWADIKVARRMMLNRVRDAVRPNVAVMNATTEALLSDDDKVNLAHIFGGADTYFRTGNLPSIYGLTWVVIPDAHFGYFDNDVTRKNKDFVKTNDIFLMTTSNGPTILRYSREALTTETWRIYDGQKEAMNLWERYNYGTYRFTNIMRIAYPHTDANGTPVTLE